MLAPWKESYYKPKCVLKSTDITLPTKFHIVEVMVFPVVMYGCEAWTIKKAEHWRIDAFELWCWRRLLRVPWTARRSNQSVLKEISPQYSSEGLMLKLKLQYLGHLIQRTESLEKTLMLGKIEGRRRRGWQRMRWWVYFHFYLVQNILKYMLRNSLTHVLFRNVLLDLQLFGAVFPASFLLLISSLVQVWLESRYCMISIVLNFFGYFYGPNVIDICEYFM